MSDTIDRTTINPTNSKEKQIANPLISYLHSFLNGNNGCYYKSEPKTVIDKHQFYVRVYGTPNKQLVPMGFYVPNDKNEFFNNLSIQYAIKWHADYCDIEYTNTVAVGIVLTGKRKICIDLDYSNGSEDVPIEQFKQFNKRLCEMFSTNSNLYIRPPYQCGDLSSTQNVAKQLYKHGAHIILEALTDDEHREATYNYIINDIEVKKIFYGNVERIVDKCMFGAKRVFWIDGSCKPESHMYLCYDMEEDSYTSSSFDIVELGDKEFGDADYSKYTDCILRDEYVDYSDQPVFSDFDKNKILPFKLPEGFTLPEPPSSNDNIKQVQPSLNTAYSCVNDVKNNTEHDEISNNEEHQKFTVKEVRDLLDHIPDSVITEGIYTTIKLPIITAVARNFEDTDDYDEGWAIIKEIVCEKWNQIIGRPKNNDIDSFRQTYYNGYKTDRDQIYTMGTVMKIVKDTNPSFYDDFCSEKYGRYDLNAICDFSDDEIDDDTEVMRGDADLPIVQDWVLMKICKRYMKKPGVGAYDSEDEYRKDRNKTISIIKSYLSQRIVFLQTPVNSCYVNGHIERNSDIVGTWKNIGKIYGTRSYFEDKDIKGPKEPTIDAINAYFNIRRVANRADFIPCNKVGGGSVEVIRDPSTGEKVLNTFKGYNPDIRSTDPVPDLSEYVPMINDFMDMIPALTDQMKMYINFHPIFMRIYILAMLNISGDILYCEYVKKFVAQMIQDPANLLPVGILFYSRCRQGKGLLIKMISQIIGDEYVVECNNRDDLLGAHRVPFENTLLVNINEARASEFGKDIVDVMKSYIDGTKHRVANRKNIQAYTYTMRSRIIATTNNANGFSFDVANGNARINAFSALNFMPDQYITQPFFAKTIDVWKKQPWFTRELYNYFNKVRYTDEDILEIQDTEYMQNIIDASVDPVEEWLQQLSEDDTQIAVYETARRKEYKNVKYVTAEDKITAAELKRAFDSYCLMYHNGYKMNLKSFILELTKYPKFVMKCDSKLNNRVVYQLIPTVCEL